MDKISTAAACIRGLSFDGEKGKILSYFSEAPDAADALKLPALPEDEAGIVDLIKKEWKGQSVVALSEGGCFILASSWDGVQALAAGKSSDESGFTGAAAVPAV